MNRGVVRGTPSKLTPEVEAEMERLWCHTAVGHTDIAHRINASFGTSFDGRQIDQHANRRGWRRELMGKSLNHPLIIEERLRTRSWERWAYPTREDNPVRHVAPGTHAAPQGGYRIGGAA